MIRTLIVDDEKLSRDSLRILLKRHRDIEVVGECANGEAAITQIRKKKPDLVFLDVQMPGTDGFAVVRDIGPEAMPIVVFVTAYDQYALRAFDAQAVDYLLKPYTDKRFEQALARARTSLVQKDGLSIVRKLGGLIEQSGMEPISSSASADRGHQHVRSLSVQLGRKLLILNALDIDWIEASDYYVTIHSKDRSYLLRQSLSSLEKRLDPREFVRIHRSIIVRTANVREMISESRRYYLVLVDGTKCFVSRRKLAAVKALIKRGVS